MLRGSYGAPRRSRGNDIYAARGFTLRLLLHQFTITIFLAKDAVTTELGLPSW